MSGTLVGVVDCLNTVIGATGNQELFTNVYTFMQRHVTVGNATLHASNFGLSGTGFDYHDGANPSGENAWAVFKFLASASSLRTTDFYVLIQWADVSSFGASPGNPGSLSDGTNNDGVGIMMAYREDNGDPWNGTTNANGADTKGTPVWAGTGLHVMSAYNETGVRSTNKEDLTLITDRGTQSSFRFSMVGDADSMWFLADRDNSGELDDVRYLGVYTPRSDLAIANPYIISSNIIGVLPASEYLTTSDEGGVMGLDESRGAVRWRLYITHHYAWGFQNPEDLGGGAQYLDFPMEIERPYDFDDGEYGLLGTLNTDLVRFTYGPAGGSTNAAFTRAFLGDSASQNDNKFSLAWGGGATPYTAVTRDGNVF